MAIQTFTFGAEQFCFAGPRALFWPRKSALLVADLHLEKASNFAMGGQMLPPYDSHEIIENLGDLAAQFNAACIYSLGDNFHDDDGQYRLSKNVQDKITALAEKYTLNWIIGNHDEALSRSFGGNIYEEMNVDGIILRHMAQRHETRPEISGHFHPKYRAKIRGRQINRVCALAAGNHLILPAFGALTGGMGANDAAIASACGMKSGDMAAAYMDANPRLITMQLYFT
ncbi:ligase-associated DNA damage response endonuclease PdeM [Sphingorhabdus lutea]|nr:ligase-associated DNA damage response endonuclease PdeM [Sphingorhabdus lutea]